MNLLKVNEMKSTMFEDDVLLVNDNIKVLKGELKRWRESFEDKRIENKWC